MYDGLAVPLAFLRDWMTSTPEEMPCVRNTTFLSEIQIFISAFDRPAVMAHRFDYVYALLHKSSTKKLLGRRSRLLQIVMVPSGVIQTRVDSSPVFSRNHVCIQP